MIVSIVYSVLDGCSWINSMDVTKVAVHKLNLVKKLKDGVILLKVART